MYYIICIPRASNTYCEKAFGEKTYSKRESWELFMEVCCSRGSRCAQPRDISFYSLFSQIFEEKQSRITRYFDAQPMNNFRPDRVQTVE